MSHVLSSATSARKRRPMTRVGRTSESRVNAKAFPRQDLLPFKFIVSGGRDQRNKAERMGHLLQEALADRAAGERQEGAVAGVSIRGLGVGVRQRRRSVSMCAQWEKRQQSQAFCACLVSFSRCCFPQTPFSLVPVLVPADTETDLRSHSPSLPLTITCAPVRQT